jgi:hypothetical protein
MGGLPTWGLGVGLTTPHRKKETCYDHRLSATLTEVFAVFSSTCWLLSGGYLKVTHEMTVPDVYFPTFTTPYNIYSLIGIVK